MIDKEYALGTWEIHLQTSEEREYIIENMKRVCKYFDTAIDYNNDYLLWSLSDYKIISKISSYHSSMYDFFVDNHFKCLKRDKIDIMLIHSNRGNWQSLVSKLENDNRFVEVGVSNFTKADIEEYKQLAGHYPKYNEIEINPYYADLETIKFCKDNGIKIIAYGIFGGKYNSPKYVADFSLPYLMLFAAQYADILIMKPESFRQTNEILDVIENYKDFGDFDFNLVKATNSTDDKSIEPMRYFAKTVRKYCHGRETYSNWCGKNDDKQLKGEVLDNLNCPAFEMLGDYQTFLRYTFRQKYDGSPVYEYDFLIGDDGNYYIVYLYDNQDFITKIHKMGRRVTFFKFYESI